MQRNRINLFLDGDQWCALFGENLQVGKAAFAPINEVFMAGKKVDRGARDALKKLREEYPELKGEDYGFPNASDQRRYIGVYTGH